MKMSLLSRLGKIRKTSIIVFLAGISGAVLGTALTPWLFILTAAALYLPPALRIFGLLKDSDEFELESIKRGVLVSWIVTGSFLFVWLIASVAGEDPGDFSGIMYFLIILQAFVFMMVRYYFFWMNRKAARIIIGIELLFWGVFVIMSAESAISLLMEAAAVVAAPVGVIILSLYKPRLSGIICIAFSIFTMFFFGVFDNLFVFVLLSIPLFLAGIALIRKYNGTG